MTKHQITTIAAFVLGAFVSVIIFYYVEMPRIIELRARDLNLMQYDGSKDKFVAKDSLHISGWELYYLQNGNMDGY